MAENLEKKPVTMGSTHDVYDDSYGYSDANQKMYSFKQQYLDKLAEIKESDKSISEGAYDEVSDTIKIKKTNEKGEEEIVEFDARALSQDKYLKSVSFNDADKTLTFVYSVEDNLEEERVLTLNHTHIITEVEGLEDALVAKAEADHNHDDAYAEKEHNHDEAYAAIDHTHEEYAEKEHNHDEAYAAIEHSHEEYAEKAHTHQTTEVEGLEDALAAKAEADHNHDEAYAAKEHSHEEYAEKEHSHATSEIEGLEDALAAKAEADHNHDEAYAAKEHSHEEYAEKEHNHDEAYAAKEHSHEEYAEKEHNHDEAYAPVNHTHKIEDIEGLDVALQAKADKDVLTPAMIEQIFALIGKDVKTADNPETFAAALANGKDVFLTDDIKLETFAEVNADNANINLNGKTLTVGGTWGLKVTGQNVEIKNGTLKVDTHNDADSNDRAIRVEGGSVSIEDVKFESPLSSFVAVQGTKNANGEISVVGCTVDAPNVEEYAMTQNGNFGGTTWTIKDTVFNTPNCNGAIYISNTKSAAKQEVVVENCEINAKGCIEVKHTNLTVKNSKLTASDYQSYIDNGNGLCTTGYDIAVTKNAKDTETSGVLKLEGNTYACIEEGKAIYVHESEIPSDYVLDTDSVATKA